MTTPALSGEGVFQYRITQHEEQISSLYLNMFYDFQNSVYINHQSSSTS